MRLGILASHPIQYHAPWFRGLAKEIELEVFFAHRPTAKEQGTGFGETFTWNIDLLSGYNHTFLENKARRPGVNHFFGCDCPQIRELICGTRHRSHVTGHKGFDAFIVCGWNLKCYWQAIRACRRSVVPVLVRGDSQLDPTRSWFKCATKQVTHRFALRQFNGFLSPGTRHDEYLLHYGVPKDRIFHVPHFVDNERFARQANAHRGQRSEIRRQWKIPEDAFCALFCGKFIPKKRPLDLVQAAQLLVSSSSELPTPSSVRTTLHLLFAGSGELGAQLRANCNVIFDAEAPSASPVTRRPSLPKASFAGFLNQTEISRAYVAADVLVLPSDSQETWGLVANEAMASGLPTVASDAAGCTPDLIDKDLIFELGDTKQLAQRIESLASTKSPQPNFGTTAASKLQIYSVETAVKRTLAATNGLVSMGGRRG